MLPARPNLRGTRFPCAEPENMDSRVQLVYYGEVIRGFKRSDVRDDLGDLLEIDEANRGALFSGARIVLKSSMDFFEAQGYEERLREVGAHVHIEPDDDAEPSSGAAATALTPDAATTAAEAPPGAAAAASVSPAVAAAAVPAAPAAVPIMLAAQVVDVTCPNCGERQPQRAICRSCGSDIAVAIAHKRETETAQRLQRLAAARARHGLAPIEDHAAPDAPSAWGLGFSGRLARLPYIAAMCWVVLAVNLLLVFAIPNPGVFKLYTLIMGTLLLAVFATRLSVLRAHDFNGSGLWAILLWIPYLGGAAALALAMLPGTPEDNEQGGRPRAGNALVTGLAVVLMSLTLVATYRWIASMVEDVLPHGGAPVEIAKEADIVARLPWPAAVTVFRDEYMAGPGNKAFAASPTGSWAWKTGAASPDSAAAAALDSCDAKRDSYTRPCELINVNGRWVSR